MSTSKPSTAGSSRAATALSDFADYVEKQQSLRNRPSVPPTTSTTSSTAVDSIEDELDIIDQLGLGDHDLPHTTNLRSLLLAPNDDSDSREKLSAILTALMAEGRGECLFDIGSERSGDSMGLTKEEYETALERVKNVAKGMGAAVTVLLTRGMGDDEAGEKVEEGKKEEGCGAQVLVRRQPKVIEELLEIRVAVVGNGWFR